MSGKVTKSIQERFDAKWKEDPLRGCWIWNGGHQGGGYGKIWFMGRLEMATRVSWFIHHGHLPHNNLQMCHKCDVPSCVNPEHLFIGTSSDNQLDCVSKGRRKYFRGLGTDWTTARVRKAIRKEFCKKGHPLAGENLYISPHGWAGCQECRRQSTYACIKRKRSQ